MKTPLPPQHLFIPPTLPDESWATRNVLPEALDALKAEDPRAQQSRRELDLFNFLMGNHAWIRRKLAGMNIPGCRLLEVGAGSGMLARNLLSHGTWEERDLIGMDMTPRPVAWPAGAGWVRGDALHQPLPEAEVVVVNLLLHQFTAPQLRIFARALPASCTHIIAVEPLRSKQALLLGRIIAGIARVSPLTVHDMVLSLHAGFRGQELPSSLDLGDWEASVSHTLRGAYRMTMRKEGLIQH